MAIKMDKIIKRELWRSIAVLFFTMLIMAYIVTKTSIPANFFTVIGIPILVTAIIFLLLIYLGKKLTKN